jgi:UTP:GlnB (protein PII) uridylyltransferase
MYLSDNDLIRFEELLDQELWEVEVWISKNKLRNLCQLHYTNSRYFKRFFIRVVQKYPDYVKFLDDTEKLRQISKGLLGNVDNLTTCEEKIKTLGDYYDLEFLRIGLETLLGTPIATTNSEFTEFTDTYLQILFDNCKQCVDEEIGRKVPTSDLLAVFTAGGHAREQAYDDDYDIIILLNSTNEDMRQYCNRIVTRMNAEIIKRGTLPHYRFADHFGHYVTLMDELDSLLSNDNDDAFIDKSQILGSRMVIGSRKFEKEFVEKIIHPHIFSKSREYILQMIAEIRSRHEDRRRDKEKDVNVKEGIGGLRDIEMILLIYKAKYGLREPINRKLMNILSEIDKRHGKDFIILADAFDFLKNVRDIYRLTVSAGDVLRADYLKRAAQILGLDDAGKESPTERLLALYRQRTSEVARIVDRMLADSEC